MPCAPWRRHRAFRAGDANRQTTIVLVHSGSSSTKFLPKETKPIRRGGTLGLGPWRCAIETASINRMEFGEDSALPFTDPRLEQVYLYWRGKAAGRAMPSRVDIDPIEIPRLLPDVMLVERHDDGRYRYRLIGTENTRAHGMNATGRVLDEVLPGPAYAPHVLGLYDAPVRDPRPLYSEYLFFPPGRQDPSRH